MQDYGPQFKGEGSVEFVVMGDGRELFRSGVMHSGDPAKPVRIDLKGVDALTLIVTDGGDGNKSDHADWINPEITHTDALLENQND